MFHINTTHSNNTDTQTNPRTQSHTHTHIYIYISMSVCVFVCVCVHVGLVGREFANGSGDRGSIPGRVIPNTLIMVLDTSLLNTQQYKVRSRVKWSNQEKGVAPCSTPCCSSYWKGSLLVALDKRSPTLLTYIYIYIYIYVTVHTS